MSINSLSWSFSYDICYSWVEFHLLPPNQLFRFLEAFQKSHKVPANQSITFPFSTVILEIYWSAVCSADPLGTPLANSLCPENCLIISFIYSLSLNHTLTSLPMISLVLLMEQQENVIKILCKFKQIKPVFPSYVICLLYFFSFLWWSCQKTIS